MNFYDFKVKQSGGAEIDFNDLRGKTVLIVNTASKCGLTPQYEGLESLYREFKDRNFTIIGFPCNQFMNQEPGNSEEAHQFCQLNYGVSFPIGEKIEVNGSQAHPLFTFLKSQQGFKGFDLKDAIGSKIHAILHKDNSEYQKNDDIKWNFTKFLVDKDGHVVERFEPTIKPSDMAEKIASVL